MANDVLNKVFPGDHVYVVYDPPKCKWFFSIALYVPKGTDPATVKEFEAWATRVVLAEIVMLPLRSRTVLLVAAVTVTAVFVPLPTVKPPPTVNVPAPKVCVVELDPGLMPRWL